MYKKILCVLVVLIMSFPYTGQLISMADEAQSLYFYEDFEGRGEAMHTRSMSFNPGGNEIVREALANGKRACIRMKSDASNPSLIKSFSDEPLLGEVIIEADLSFKNLGGCSPKIAIRSIGSENYGGYEIYLLSVYKLSDIRTADGAKLDFALEEGRAYSFSFAVDIDSCSYDIYIDGVLKKSDISFSGEPLKYEFNEITSLLFNTRDAANTCSTEYRVDNIKVYKGSVPLSDAEFKAENWKLSNIGRNELTPAMAALVSKGLTAIYKGSKSYMLNGELKENDTPVNSPSDIGINTEGKYILEDKTGLCLIADTPIAINWREDKPYLLALLSELIYERPKGTELIQSLKNANMAHPRLLGDSGDFDTLKSEIAENPTKARWYSEVKKMADRYCNQTVATLPETVTATTTCIDQAIELKEMAPTLALVYRIEGAEGGRKYAERLAAELRAWADAPVWGSYSMLAYGRAAAGIAFAYDWLYDVLDSIDPTLKADIKTAVKNNFYTELTKDYYNITPRSRSYKWNLRLTGDNWNTTINSALIMSAIAFGDEEGYGEEYAYLLDEAMYSIEAALNQLAPDGAWFEGPAYWTPTIEAIVWAQAGLEKVFGTSFGLSDVAGMREAPYYLYEMSASSGIFNFNFAHHRGYICPILMYYGKIYNDSSLMQLCIDHYERFKGNYEQFDYWMTGDALLLSGDIPESCEIKLPLDSYYRDTEAVSMRSSFEREKEFFVGFHSGYNGAQNAQLDIGTFVIEAYGDRFISDFGPEVYAIADASGNIFKAYMNRAEGANTYIVNPSADFIDQEIEADCYFQEFESNSDSAFAITDMTAAYGDKLLSAKRGIKMTNNRGSVILRDEIVCKSSSDIYWGMHTPADVTLQDNGKVAILNINGNYMEAKILSEQGTFIEAKAEPLDTAYKLEGESTHPDITKLAMDFKDVESVDVSICFTPLGNNPEKEIKYPKNLALDNWDLDELKLDSLTIDGDKRGAKATLTLSGSSALTPDELSIIAAAYSPEGELCDIAITKKAICSGANYLEVSFDEAVSLKDKLVRAYLIDMKNLKPYTTCIGER